MRELLTTIQEWIQTGSTKVAVARVIKTWGSSPRPVGSIMLVNESGKIAGSVSGGCVEGAVAKVALEVLEKGKPRLLSYGVSNEDAWTVGLACGGKLDVFVEAVDFENDVAWKQILDSTINNQGSTLISRLSENDPLTALSNDINNEKDKNLASFATLAFEERKHQLVEHEGAQYFIQTFPRKPLLLLIGAAHITVDLVAQAQLFGFETVVIDPRGYFAENITFTQQPDSILNNYPSEVLDQFPLDAYTFVAVLSHDPKIDDDALKVLLKKPVAYIGALGSKKTHQKRIERLQEAGFSEKEISRIHAPIGVNINAKSAREIALSVISQIIEVKNQFC